LRRADANNVWDPTAQRPAVDAHYGAMKTYDDYKNVHGRTGINGSGGPGAVAHVDNANLKLQRRRSTAAAAPSTTPWPPPGLWSA